LLAKKQATRILLPQVPKPGTVVNASQSQRAPITGTMRPMSNPVGQRHIAVLEQVIDTYRESPDDFCDPEQALRVNATSYIVHARSVVLLMNGSTGGNQ
jgi:hypothetical protein